MRTKVGSVAELPTLPSLEPLPTLPVTKFPSFEDLVSQEIQRSNEQQDDGLFAQLVGDPAILYREYLDSPENFDEETVKLLTELMSRQKTLEELSKQEKELLNQATIQFAQGSPKPSSSPKPSVKQSPIQDEEEEEVPYPKSLPTLNAPIDVPESIPKTEWWKNLSRKPGPRTR